MIIATGAQYQERDDGVDQGGHGDIIGRVYIDEIEFRALFCKRVKSPDCVESDDLSLAFDFKRGDVFFDAGDRLPILFDESRLAGSAADRFDSHRSAARE